MPGTREPELMFLTVVGVLVNLFAHVIRQRACRAVKELVNLDAESCKAEVAVHRHVSQAFIADDGLLAVGARATGLTSK